MSSRPFATLLVASLLAGCSATSPRASAPSAPVTAPVQVAAETPGPNDNLNAVAWSQTAVEHDLIYVQTYRDAQSRLLAALRDKHWDALSKSDRVTPIKGLKPAVILDIDETVLDNAPFAARMIRGNRDYNEAAWAVWCKEAHARALPGAVAFTRFAVQHGIAVIYISNRAKDLDQVTLANLRSDGFPVSGADAFLGLGTVVAGCEQSGSEKGCRRQQVGSRYRVLMQFGDQLGDFLDVNTATEAGRRQVVEPYMAWIGTRWFVLPNATYGAWETALFGNDWSGSAASRRKQKIASLHVN